MYKFMNRKIVKQGAATLMISLPAKWAKAQNLDKGDEISIEESGENLILTTSHAPKKTQSEKIDISNYSPLVNRVLIAQYIKGTDELEVTFSNPQEIKDFQRRVVNELIGFEIIKQSHSSMTLKAITESDIQDIDDLIKRIFFIIDSMIEELVTSLENKKDLEPVIEIDSSINKFVNFCLRILNKKGYKDNRKTSNIYGIVSQLEEIGDIYKSIAKTSEEIKPDKDQISVLKETRKSLKLFEENLFKFEKEKAVQFAKNYISIKNKIKNKNKLDFYLFQLNEQIVKMNNHLLVFAESPVLK